MKNQVKTIAENYQIIDIIDLKFKITEFSRINKNELMVNEKIVNIVQKGRSVE
jgi:hypothetical protein